MCVVFSNKKNQKFIKCLSEQQTGKTLIRLLQKQSVLGLGCVSKPYWQATNVQNFRIPSVHVHCTMDFFYSMRFFFVLFVSSGCLKHCYFMAAVDNNVIQLASLSWKFRSDVSCEPSTRKQWTKYLVLFIPSGDFQEHYRGSNGLDPDQDPGPNCLQRSSAHDKSHPGL